MHAAGRKRLWKILAGLLVLLVGFVLLLPAIAAPIVKGIAVDAIEESLHARATIDELSFSLGGSAHVGGIVLVDLDGRPLASIETVDASIDLLAALGGTYRFDLAVDGVEAHVRQNADGSWNVATLAREGAEKEKKDEEKPGDESGPLELHGPIRFSDGRVFVHGLGGDTVVSALEFAADFAGSEKPAVVSAAGRIEQGTLAISGSIPGDPSSLGELSELSGELELRIDEAIDLADLAPALAAVFPLDGLEGRFHGDGRVALQPGFEFTAVGGFALEGVRVQGTLEGSAPVAIERVKLHAESSEDGAGGIRQKIELSVDDFLTATFDGTLSDPTADEATLEGKFKLDGELSRLGEIARGWVAVREGLVLEGGLGAGGDVKVELQGGAPRTIALTLAGGVDALEATDSVEGPIDLGELSDPSCRLSLTFDVEAGALDVTEFVVEAGPVQARGVATVTGLAGGEPQLGETKVDLSADLDRLHETIGELVDLGEGSLGGSVEAHLTASEEGERVAVDGNLTARGLVLPHGTTGSTEYGDFEAAAHGTYSPAEGRLDLTDLRAAFLDLGVEATGKLLLDGLDSDEGLPPVIVDLRADLSADLDRLGEISGEWIDLGAGSLGGMVEAHLTVSEEGERVAIDGNLTARGLVLPSGASESVEYGDVRATVRGTYSPAEARLELTELFAAVQGVEVTGRALLEGLDRAQGLPDATVDLQVKLVPADLPGWIAADLSEAGLELRVADATLAGSLREERFDVDASLRGAGLGLLLPETLSASGEELTLQARAEGTLDQATISGRAVIAGLEMRTLPADPGEPALELTENSVVLEFAGQLTVAPGDVAIERVKVESGFVQGALRGNVAGLRTDEIVFDGVEGELTYIPDRLGVLLAPWLPGKLTGAAPETCRLRLDGRLAGVDAASLLAGVDGSVHVGIGRFETTGFDLTGGMDLDVKDGTATLASTFDANGGKLKLDGVLELDKDEGGVVFSKRSTLVIGAHDVRANSGLAPMLAYVHPAFSGLQNLQKSSLGGILGFDAKLSYDGPLSLAVLEGGWEALPKEHVNGEMTFRIEEAVIAGSPLISDLLAKFDVKGVKQFDIKPIQLDVRAGRIFYAKPWEWKIAGAKTTFGGSIGLDESMAMNWSIPISREMVARNDFLKALEGQTIDIPIRGTVSRPKLDVDLFALAGDLAKDTLKGELKGALGLGGKAGGEDPGTLLRQADKLWKQGKKVQAAAIYKKIRSDHKLTLVYTLNRRRIKDRSKYTE